MTFQLNIKTADDLADEAKQAARGAIKIRRNQAMNSGMTVAGVPVHTDDQSQSRITGAALAATIDPDTVVKWKAANGSFITIDAPTIISIAQAIRAHVQACFDREAELLAALEAGETHDIEDGWPDGT